MLATRIYIQNVNEAAKFLRLRRNQLRMKQAKVAVLSELSEPAIRGYEKKGFPAQRQQFEKLERLLDVLFVKHSAIGRLTSGKAPLEEEILPIPGIVDELDAKDSIPSGIAPARLLAVPTFKLKTAAGRWSQTSIVEFFTDNPDAQEYIRAGRFKIEIEGDCMESRYYSGQVIEFEIMRGIDRGLVLGQCYVVCRSDGDTTFKCLVNTDEDGIELGAVNQKKYPGTFRVPWQEIARISAPASVEKPPPPPEILKILKPKDK